MNTYFKETSDHTKSSTLNGQLYETTFLVLGGPVDPFFRHQLWLQAALPDGLL